MHVIGVRRSKEPHPHVDELIAPDELHRALPRADFVVVTAALTPGTRGMIGAKELALLRPEAGLVNMARAAIVDYDALVARLEAGKLRGAIVDVCYKEPLPADAPLRSVPNLLITPHISSDPADYATPTIELITDNLIRLLAGRELTCRVDPARGY